ncbi:YchJ family protein [Virgisporangium aurantiacum]|uniref:UPF0225 protein Vau01_002330 n=1 Tax=Virgisporangium aurantiacum TaxID=175570 RepID=A0A8J3YY58_9ACTN|nr:YchJ family protein [Virgisporangium aurantiacum]GIJ52717.1 UPF0225 protein [Virgisporangium aurantiacum]
MANDDDPCPCGGGTYGACCGRAHRSEPAATAEALMRSRYSAFALRDADHLLRTWHPDTRPDTLDLPTGRRWTRLRVLATERGGADDTEGTVEFRAHFRDRGEPGVLSERSRFERVDGAWHYVDGDVHPSQSS